MPNQQAHAVRRLPVSLHLRGHQRGNRAVRQAGHLQGPHPDAACSGLGCRPLVPGTDPFCVCVCTGVPAIDTFRRQRTSEAPPPPGIVLQHFWEACVEVLRSRARCVAESECVSTTPPSRSMSDIGSETHPTQVSVCCHLPAMHGSHTWPHTLMHAVILTELRNHQCYKHDRICCPTHMIPVHFVRMLFGLSSLLRNSKPRTLRSVCCPALITALHRARSSSAPPPCHS